MPGQVTQTGVLDDLIQQAPRARFDLYVSRSRLVMYVNGQPRLLNLAQVIHLHLAHRREVIIRRTRYELYQAKSRAHQSSAIAVRDMLTPAWLTYRR